MTLQKRLIVALLLTAPLSWALTIGMTYWRAAHEINELYDTDMVRMAQQMRALLPLFDTSVELPQTPAPARPAGDQGDAAPGDLSVSVWLPDGRALNVDPDGDALPRNDGQAGFMDTRIGTVPWRLYYLDDDERGWRIAVGQRLGERDDLVLSYIGGQILPWLLGLPILLALMIWSVRRALAPVRALSEQIASRSPDDPQPLALASVPGELLPLVSSMNQLLGRVAAAIERERRLTADAAHELRTPLAALKSQWEVAERAPTEQERLQARANVALGIERLNRLVSQLLTMSRLENGMHAATFLDQIEWHKVMEQALSDCLWLARRRDVDVEVLWEQDQTSPLPTLGDPNTLGIMLRNLLDNAIRYSPPGATVTVSFSAQAIVLDNEGEGVAPDVLARIGDRFFRQAGQQEKGSGLGVSIAQRAAQQHGLKVTFSNVMRDGKPGGFRASVQRDH